MLEWKSGHSTCLQSIPGTIWAHPSILHYLNMGKTQTLDLWFIATSSSLWEGTIAKLHLRVNCLITLIYIVSRYQNENNWFLDFSILSMDNLFTLLILMNLKALESHSPTWWFSSSCFARWNYWTTWENGVISIQTSKILSRKSNILKFLISHWILYLLVDDPFYIRYCPCPYICMHLSE